MIVPPQKFVAGLVVVSALAAGSVLGQSQPAHDELAQRAVFPPMTSVVTATNTVLVTSGFGYNNIFATPEPGEPKLSINAKGKTIWWSWTPPVHGLATIRFRGTNGLPPFGRLIRIFTG